MRNEPQIFINFQRQQQPIDSETLIDLTAQLVTETATRSETVTSVISLAGHDMNVEVVKTPTARRKGLMHRREIGSDGMLFVMDASPASFHMANTHIPLEILYFDAADRLMQIDTMVPKIGRSHCDNDVVHALEVGVGTCRSLGIKVGDRLVLDRGTTVQESLLRQLVIELFRTDI